MIHSVNVPGSCWSETMGQNQRGRRKIMPAIYGWQLACSMTLKEHFVYVCIILSNLVQRLVHILSDFSLRAVLCF